MSLKVERSLEPQEVSYATYPYEDPDDVVVVYLTQHQIDALGLRAHLNMQKQIYEQMVINQRREDIFYRGWEKTKEVAVYAGIALIVVIIGIPVLLILSIISLFFQIKGND